VHAQQLESAVVPTAAQSHAFRIEAGRAAWYALAEALLPFGLDLSEDGDGKLAKPSNRSGYAFAASTCSALAKVRNDLMEAIRLGQVVLRISRHRGHPFHGIADSISREGGHRFTLIADSVSA